MNIICLLRQLYGAFVLICVTGSIFSMERCKLQPEGPISSRARTIMRRSSEEQQYKLLIKCAQKGSGDNFLIAARYLLTECRVEARGQCICDGDTLLHRAVRNKNKLMGAAFIELFLAYKVPIDAINREGFTALKLAIYLKNAPAAKILIENNARLDDASGFVVHEAYEEYMQNVLTLLGND